MYMKTYKVYVHTIIWYVTLHLRDRRGRSFVLLRKSRQNHRSYVWTEAKPYPV